jgi:hypothetical protein
LLPLLLLIAQVMNVFVAFFVLLLLLLADNTPPAASTIPLIGEIVRPMAVSLMQR